VVRFGLCSLALVLFSVLPLSTPVSAQILTDALAYRRSSDTELTAGIGSVKSDYKAGGARFDVENLVVAAGLGLGLTPGLRLSFQAGVIPSSDASFIPEKGDGHVFGLGLSKTLVATRRMRAGLYGNVSRTTQRYSFEESGQGIDAEMTTTDLRLGATIAAALSSAVSLFSSIEAVLFSDGDLDTRSEAGTSGKASVERVERFVLRVGASFMSGRYGVRPEVALVGERSFLLGGFWRF
jgi:hypothetical protein